MAALRGGQRWASLWVVVSQLLFVLAMEMVLRGAGRFAQGVEVANGQVIPPVKTSRDRHGITLLTWDRECTTQLLTRLEA